eukprot:g17483.t1
MEDKWAQTFLEDSYPGEASAFGAGGPGPAGPTVLFEKVGDKGGGGRSGGDEHKLETVRKADLRTPRDPVPVLEGDGEHGDRVTGSSIVGSRWNARQSPATFLQPGGYGAEDGNFGGPNEGTVHKKLTTVRPESHSSGPKKLTTVRPESRDCVGEWKSEPCKDGKTSKKFHVKTKKKGNGASCETVDNDTRENIDCGTNCEGIWRDWGDECSDDGKRTRRFHVVHKAKDGGKDCDNEDGDKQEEDCDAPAVNCKGKFQLWGACKAGFRERFYKVTQQPKNGGEDCGRRGGKDTEECGNPCKEEWAEWGPPCTPDLIQTRAWLWKRQPTNNGRPCTTRPVESRKCGHGGKEPPRDCEGAWELWTNCVNGRMSRTYKRTHDAEPGGEDCEHENNYSYVAQCGQPCEGAWSNWSKCTGGHRTRHYKVKKPASTAGSPAGEGRQCEVRPKDHLVPIQNGHPESKECKATDCYGRWSDFTHCKDGKQTRTFTLITRKGPGGAKCEHEDLDQIIRDCGTNCDGSWGRWSRCVAGQEGQQTQVFIVDQPALEGGKDCTVADRKTRHLPCGEEPPPRVKGEGSAQVDFVLHHGHEHEARPQEREFGVQLSCRAKWMIVVLVVSFLGMIAVGGGLFAFGERLCCDPDGVVTPGSRESIQYHYGSDEESEGDERDSETRHG